MPPASHLHRTHYVVRIDVVVKEQSQQRSTGFSVAGRTLIELRLIRVQIQLRIELVIECEFQRLPAALDEAKPQLVILCHGGNDFLRKLDEARAANNIRAMVRLARSRGAEVVLIGVPKPGLLPSPAGFYADIAREFRLPYEAKALKKILTDNGLKSDLVHPNAAGYARLAEAIAALLRKTGAV